MILTEERKFIEVTKCVSLANNCISLVSLKFQGFDKALFEHSCKISAGRPSLGKDIFLVYFWCVTTSIVFEILACQFFGLYLLYLGLEYFNTAPTNLPKVVAKPYENAHLVMIVGKRQRAETM